MIKIYKTSVLACSQFLKTIFVLFGILLTAGALHAQVSVTATAGVPGPTSYGTLKAAFDAINVGTHQGAIVISVTGTTETAPAVLNSSGAGSAVYTSVRVQPNGPNRVITGSLAALDIIQLNGADNVTIDGFDAGGNLTISNTASTGGPGVIWVSCASATNGATNNIIQNCKLTGNTATTTVAGIMSSGTSYGSIAEIANNNNTYQNNVISLALEGIQVVGPTGNESGTVIAGNTITNTSDLSIGIFQQTGVSVTGNTISGNSSTVSGNGFSNTGIYVGGTISGGLINKNSISNIKKSGPWGCSGILLESTSGSSNLAVVNNFIYDVAAGGWASTNEVDDNGFGIAVNTGGGYKIYFNSVKLTSNQTTGTTAAFWISGLISAAGSMDVRDNIFTSFQTSPTLRYPFYSNGAPATVFSNIDYNDYYDSLSTRIGFLGGAQNSLAAFQTATGKDGNSQSLNPRFASATNLHLLLSSPLDGAGSVLGSVTDDIDGQARPLPPSILPDMGADEFNPADCSTLGTITAGTVSASPLSLCSSGTSTLTASGFSYGFGMTYQWQYFNGSIWVDLTGETNPFSASTGIISATRQFRLALKCHGGPPIVSVTPVTVTVNNPTLSGTTPGSRCGVGTVTLGATAPVGTTINWYANSTGGSPIGTGNSFVTPVISATTTFWAAPNAATAPATVGAPVSGSSCGTKSASGLLDWPLRFNTTTSVTIVSAWVIPFAAGNFTVALRNSLSTSDLQTANFTFTAGEVGLPKQITLNFLINTPGSYQITNSIGGVSRIPTFTCSYPMTSPNGGFSIVGSAFLSSDPTVTAYYNSFYDIEIVENCENNTRTAVPATITAPPAFTSVLPNAGPGRTICQGSSVTLNATGAAYTSITWNQGTIPNNSVVSPTITTTYTVSGTSATCRRDSAVTITVVTLPTDLIVTPASAAVCPSTVTAITATGGKLIGLALFRELFEGSPTTQFTLSGTGVTAAQNTTYYQQGNSSLLLSYGNSSNGQLAMNSDVNLSLYTNPKITFYQICGTEAGFDYGHVQFSTNSGASWSNFVPGDYVGTGVLKNGEISFDKSSYPDWDAMFPNYPNFPDNTPPGAGPGGSLWKLETINLNSYIASTTFRIRFRVNSDFVFNTYGWLVDNVNITGDQQAPVIWTPAGGELFFDLACTDPNDAIRSSLVMYTKPTGPHLYTATAGIPGCSKTATSNITIATGGSPTISIAASTAVCQGSSVTFTATITNAGATPGFLWRRNGVQINTPPAGYNQNPGHNPYTYSGPLVNGDLITCQLNSSAACSAGNPVSNTLIMTVYPKPSVSIDQLAGAICFPTTLTTTLGATPVTTYEWFLNGGSVGGNTSTLAATGPGTYDVIVTTVDGCKDTSTRVFTQKTYNVTATATNGTISPSGTTVVNCGASQIFTYSTSNPGFSICDVIINGVSQGALPSPYTFNNITGDSSISVVFCNASCGATYNVYAGNDAGICANSTYTLGGTSNCTGCASSFTSTWSTSVGGDGTFSPGNTWGTATTYTPGPNDIANGSVDLILTSNNPGPGTCSPVISAMTLQIKAVPVVTISGFQGICPSSTRTLTAIATIATGTITGYTWSNGVGPFNLASHTFNTAAGAGTVTVTGSTSCSTITPYNIIAYTAPTLGAPNVTGTLSICQGGTTIITANITSAGNGGATLAPNGYQWYSPNAPTIAPGPITTQQSYTVTAIGNYTVKATNDHGCTSSESTVATITYTNIPMVGNYTIGMGAASCTNYVSFGTAIADLNARSVGGNVRFDIPAGYTETVPAGGLALGAAALNIGSDSISILFIKSGTGANPLLTAPVGTAASPNVPVPDGIWSLRGINNVTIDGINLIDNNAAGNGTMEYGFGLFKWSATDGARSNTIRNSTISLQRSNVALGSALMPDGSTGIAVCNCLATTATTATSATSYLGANSKNKFYSNTIKNVTTGIGILGFNAGSPYTLADSSNDIGGISSATADTIINFGGFPASTVTAIAVNASNQYNLNIGYNLINNNNGAGANHPNNLRGIRTTGGNAANITISHNDITLKASGSNSLCTAIDNAIGGTGSATNTVSIINNSITGSYTTATSGSMTGIFNNGAAATVNMSDNTIQNYSFPGTGPWVGMQNNVASGVLTLNMNNNLLQNCNVSSSGSLVGIDNNGTVTNNINMSNNTVTGMIKGTSNSDVLWLKSNAGASATTTTGLFASNIITNNEVTGLATAINIFCIRVGTCSYTADNNFIYNNGVINMSGNTANLFGFSNTGAAGTENITNNIIRKLYITGTATAFLHNIIGINASGTGATNNKTISNNIVDSLYSGSNLSTVIVGIRNTNASGVNVNIFKNKVSGLFPGQSVTLGSYAAGIRIASGPVVNVYNNFINLDLLTSNVLTGNDALKGIEIGGGTTLKLYYNTIRLAGSGVSTSAFGSSGIGFTVSTPTTDMRNNIVVNLTTPGTATSPPPLGYAVALRRFAAVTATYATTSNNNNFYAGTPSASHLLYYDGTTGYQTLGNYLAGAGISPRETASVSALPNFLSATDLHLQPGNNCSSDGAAQVITGYTTDIDTETRPLAPSLLPDIGADEFTGTGVGVGVWTGAADTDWNNVLNWCDAVPDLKTNVTIPAGAPRYPVITAATPVAVANNISIVNNAWVKITGVGKLGIYGAITVAGNGVIHAGDGTVEMLGSAAGAQSIPANTFGSDSLKNLIVSNVSPSTGVTLGAALNLYGKLSFTVSTKAFTSNGLLTLKSNASGTASVGDITNNGANTGNTVVGKVTVERFIRAKKAWHFLSAPTRNLGFGQTIHQSWQENQLAGATTPAGFGIQITNNLASWNTYGFDGYSPAGPSVKTYVPATNVWKGIDSTGQKFITGTGYMAFIRGDRTANLISSPVTTTVLRVKDTLAINNVVSAPIVAGKFGALGNPYASAIDFNKIPLGNRPNTDNVYYLFDPQFGTYGAYATFIPAGPIYTVAVGTPSYPLNGNYYIESGQAFFVHNSSASAGSVTFTEPVKVDGSNLVSRVLTNGSQLRTNLYVVDASGTNLFDGVLSQFDASYSTQVDNSDVVKMNNFGENLGIASGDKNLVVEKRAAIVQTDTIFYHLAQLRVKNYQFEFVPENMDAGLEGFLEDRYLHTSTPVSMIGNTTVDFNVTADAGSYAADRFYLVFRQAGPVPVSFTSIRANRQNSDIMVEWTVQNQLNIDHYDVEKSRDGINFTKVNQQAARSGSGTIQYNWLDVNPFDGDNFYRVKSVGITSESKLSQVVKVNMKKLPSVITVFPNPVRDDRIVYVSLDNQPAGEYQVKLINNSGQAILKKSLNHAGGSSVYSIELGKQVAHGNYILGVAGDNNVNLTFKIVY